jgi:hypothetical protein
LKSRIAAWNLAIMLSGGNIQIFGGQKIRIHDKLSPQNLSWMTKTRLFVPVINNVMIPNALQKAIIKKTETMILRGKCGFEVPILNDLTS